MKYLLILVCCFGSLLRTQAQSVGPITAYKNFMHSGSTAGLWYTFHHPADYASTVDTTNINVPPVLSSADFQQLIATARKSKHSPTKIAGITLAGTMMIDKDQHFYLYCVPALLIDLTAKLNYQLAPGPARNFAEKTTQLPRQE